MNMLGHAYFILPKGAWVEGNDHSKPLGFVVLTYFNLPGLFLSSEPEGRGGGFFSVSEPEGRGGTPL